MTQSNDAQINAQKLLAAIYASRPPRTFRWQPCALVIAGLLLLTYTVNDTVNFYRFVTTNITVDAKITKATPDYAMDGEKVLLYTDVVYGFSTKGKTYQGFFTSYKGGQVGDGLIVMINPHNPEQNRPLGEEVEKGNFIVGFTVMIGVAVWMLKLGAFELWRFVPIERFRLPKLPPFRLPALKLPPNLKQLALQHLSAIILGSAIVLAVTIHAVSTRYVHTSGGYVLDKWTGRSH